MIPKKATEIKTNDWIYIYDSICKKYKAVLIDKIVDLDTITQKPQEHENCLLFVSVSSKQIIVNKESTLNFIKEYE